MRGIVFDIDDTLYCRQDMLVRAAETVLGVKVPDWPLFISNAPMQLLWHLAFTWLYRRYGNLYGSAVLHGCVDMCSGIFA